VSEQVARFQERHHVVHTIHVPLTVGTADDRVARSRDRHAGVVQDVAHPDRASILKDTAFDILLHLPADLLADVGDRHVDFGELRPSGAKEGPYLCPTRITFPRKAMLDRVAERGGISRGRVSSSGCRSKSSRANGLLHEQSSCTMGGHAEPDPAKAIRRAGSAAVPDRMTKDFWSCPKCHRVFTQVNQRHACGTGSRDEVLRNRPVVLVRIYELIEAYAKTLGPIEIVTRQRYALFRSVRIFADLTVMTRCVRLVIHLRR
jgi:hypothetical protein